MMQHQDAGKPTFHFATLEKFRQVAAGNLVDLLGRQSKPTATRLKDADNDTDVLLIRIIAFYAKFHAPFLSESVVGAGKRLSLLLFAEVKISPIAFELTLMP
jgi:hypothetical protein